MRLFLLAVVSACLALVLPCLGWAHGAVYAMTNEISSNHIVAWSRASDGTLTYMDTYATGGGGSGIQFGNADKDDTLGSQGSVVIDPAHRFLFAVNTENTAENLYPRNLQDCNQGSISSFRIWPDGSLTLVGKVSSGGLFPNSLTLRGSQLYVLNAGGGAASGCGTDNSNTPNITGFYVSPAGVITAIPGATQAIAPGPDGTAGFLNCDPSLPVPCGLSPPFFVRSPGQVGFTPDGKSLIVTVKGTNSIYVFPVNPKKGGGLGSPVIWGFGLPPQMAPEPTYFRSIFDSWGYFVDPQGQFFLPSGRGSTGLGSPTVFQAAGTRGIDPEPTYFGFTFAPQGQLIVTEPFGGAPITSLPTPNASAVSSFIIGKNGVLTPISSHIVNFATASCWVALDPRTRSYAYTTNNVSGSISSFTLDSNGTLMLLDPIAADLSGPNDLATVKDTHGSFLYVVASDAGEVYAYQINRDGTLTLIGSYPGLPTVEATSQGIAAY
jgi:6-phosphogluconolactonase